MSIAAFEDIVAHAMQSETSEQPSFYHILCGGATGLMRVGDDRCLYTSSRLAKALAHTTGNDASVLPLDQVPNAASIIPTPQHSLVVVFLDRLQYPNGAVHDYWSTDLHAINHNMRILHNNWVVGTRSKVTRLIEHRMWFYDVAEMVCLYDDHPSVSMELAKDAVFGDSEA